MRSSSFLQFHAYLIVLLILLTLLFIEISKIVPTPFMDEIFHVKQAMEYFNGNWLKWDPMITTPPGLYFISVAIMKIFHQKICSINHLRLVNAAFGLGNFIVSQRIAIKLKLNFATERAFLIALLPNLFIFYELFYTDAGSSFFCLLAYLNLIEGNSFAFLLSSIVSLSFRQTNIIWVGLFFIADRINRKFGSDIKTLWSRKCEIFRELIMGIVLFVIFGIGVIFNDGSIALGDKGSHQISPHFSQFFYFTLMTGLFCVPIIYSNKSKLKRNVLIWGSCLYSLMAGLAIHYGTIIHPYLIADNRHWTNVFWRRFLRVTIFESRVSGRYLLLPFYGVSLVFLIASIERDWIWIIGYFFTCAVVLIPSPLIEPRYYILPMIIYLLNCRLKSGKYVFLQIGLFSLINAFIVGMFLYRPFGWAHVPHEIQRRIW